MKSLPSKFTNQNICVTHFISVALCACQLVLNYHCWILDMLDVKIVFIIVSIFSNGLYFIEFIWGCYVLVVARGTNPALVAWES